MATVGDPGRALAVRLRKLRKSRWPDISITQAELAEALSGRKKASVQLVSSWERTSIVTLPPEDRLNAILTFFCTRRSIEARPYRLIGEQDLTADEIEARAVLRDELFALREAALALPEAPPDVPAPSPRSIVGRGPWHYKVGPVVIVVADPGNEAPSASLDPDRSKLSRLADLDSLMELYGHLRAVNPDLDVRYVSARDMQEDDWTAHLVLVGGIDWNEATQDAMRLTPVPVTQHSDDDDPSRGCFRVVDRGEDLSFARVRGSWRRPGPGTGRGPVLPGAQSDEPGEDPDRMQRNVWQRSLRSGAHAHPRRLPGEERRVPGAEVRR
ncbi:XRE family transcriptional regulator [Amorphoplanes digitatis]|uniref:XRE family transcriptional regulator n=1 Tax=Actinoplanes digitatis TaxID=1868 RepID=UPI00361EF761